MTNKTADLVQIQLKVHKTPTNYSSSPRDHLVALLGPVTEKEKLTTEIPQRCFPTGFDEWIKHIWVPKNKAIFYRFAIIQAQSSAVIEKEVVEEHRAFIGLRHVTIKSEYNEQEYFTVQGHDRIHGIRKRDKMRSLEMVPRISKHTDSYSDARERLLCDPDRTKHENENETDCPKIIINSTDGDVKAENTISREDKICTDGLYKYLLPVGIIVATGLTVYSIARFLK